MSSTPSYPPNLLSSVPKLTSQNYSDWKFAIELVFRSRGCHGVATGKTPRPSTGTEAWDKLAQDALIVIGLTVDTSQYPYIRKATITNGPEAWQALKDIYEKNSRANRISLKHAFYGYGHNINRPVQEYITGVTNAGSRLQSIGITLSDEDISDVLIFNLDTSYANIAGALTATKGTLSVADVSGALIDEEARRGGFQEETLGDISMQSSYNGRGPPNRGKTLRDNDRNDQRRLMTCFSCGKKGHVAYDCPDRADLRNEDPDDRSKYPKTNRSNYASHDYYDESYADNVNTDLLDYAY